MTDLVTVSAPAVRTYDIDLTYYIGRTNKAQAAAIQNRVSEAIDAYNRWQTTEIGRDINPSELIRRIREAGAKRPVIVSPEYTPISDTEVAQLGILKVSYGGLRMINIHDGQITNLLSNSHRYILETISIIYAILQEKRRILYLAERTLLMAAVEILDEKTLDYLAVELRTPAYSDNYPIETKRTLIKGTLPYYERLGTPAVNWVIKAIFGNGAIQEWFDYDGDPHHFQVDIPITGLISPEIMEELRRTLSSVKRLTSWLDSITTYFEMEGKVYITPFLGQPLGITTLPELEPVFPGNLVHLTPILGNGPQSTTLPPLEPLFPTAAIFGRASAVLQSITETALPVLKENDTTHMPELTAHTAAAVQTVTETSLPYIEQMPPRELEIVQRITARPLLPLTETRLPRLNDFDTTITAVCRSKATAALQNISETRLPELEE